MQLWIAAVISLAGVGLSAAFVRAYRREKKRRFLLLAIATMLIALVTLAYTALAFILVGGID